MKPAAARAIAELTPEDEIVPDVLDQRVDDAVARAVRQAADHSGVSRGRRWRRPLSRVRRWGHGPDAATGPRRPCARRPFP